MAQFIISVWHDETYEVDFSTPEAQERVAMVSRFNEELRDAGSWVFAAGLYPSSTAKVVRSSQGVVTTSDGPYATSPEQMGGFWIIEASGIESALEWARKAAVASDGPVEVRQAQG